MKQEFVRIAKRFDGLETKIDAVNFKVDVLEKKTDDGFVVVAKEFDRISRQIEGITGMYVRLDTEDVALRARQDRLEACVDSIEQRPR
ncbi:hypothetical protein A2304_03500 [Candidatus Uhrbacteria bacterium RIFOXYB2_FULL_57_15]|uniref:Uncharacterized protein n=1 Tax=Candidatus Uhrbacteria bacterium RIFOXYB2_FULL_57_15 TaxID=1802422 RepID=A0A1F7W5P7_9BACT|nr:MAG: hypothetical protein A2304_03500 [Candidatus Uhrbacteria bacterium RIFOXYB2_FULL_57_15]